MELSELREKIDEIDDELVSLFVKRMEVAAQIAEYKRARNLPILQPAREQEKLQAVAEKAGPKLAEDTRELYSKLFELSRNYQSRQRGD